MRTACSTALAAGLLALVGCGSGDAPEQPEDAPGAEPVDAVSADPAGPDGPRPADVRAADLAAKPWWDALGGRLVDPAPPGSGDRWRVGERRAYADADGDGDLDVLAPLVRGGGGGGHRLWHIWVWEDGDVRQVREPVAHESPCGDEVARVRGTADGFELTERLRSRFQRGDCGTAPRVRSQRVVALDTGWPVLRTGLGGFGGVCPQPAARDAGLFTAREQALRTAPDPRLPRLESSSVDWLARADVGGRPWLRRDGWALVSFGPYGGGPHEQAFDGYGDFTPCAWVRAHVVGA